jgi:hypothetical protein
VRQLNLRPHPLDSLDYTPRTGFLRCTMSRQDRQIRLPHLRSHFTTAVESAATIAGRGNQCISAQTVRNRQQRAGLCAPRPNIRIAPLVVSFVHHHNLTRQCSGQRNVTCARMC